MTRSRRRKGTSSRRGKRPTKKTRSNEGRADPASSRCRRGGGAAEGTRPRSTGGAPRAMETPLRRTEAHRQRRTHAGVDVSRRVARRGDDETSVDDVREVRCGQSDVPDTKPDRADRGRCRRSPGRDAMPERREMRRRVSGTKTVLTPAPRARPHRARPSVGSLFPGSGTSVACDRRREDGGSSR